jgi:itaconyl-CoA hydratase
MTEQWRGRFLEDFAVGDVYRSRLGRTVSTVDNTWFTLLTMNTNQMHFNAPYAARTEFGQPLVVSTLTLAIVLGLSVADTSENAAANLGWNDIKLPKPVYAEDTLWAESEVLSVRESKSRPSCGIVGIRTRGINQRGEVVIEFTRSFLCFKGDAPEVVDVFPATTQEWTVPPREGDA